MIEISFVLYAIRCPFDPKFHAPNLIKRSIKKYEVKYIHSPIVLIHQKINYLANYFVSFSFYQRLGEISGDENTF